MKTLNQTVQDIESKVDSITNMLQTLQALIEANGVDVLAGTLAQLTENVDGIISKVQGLDTILISDIAIKTNGINDKVQSLNTVAILSKVLEINQLLQPATPPPTPEELALQAAQALANLQNQLYLQSQNVPPPTMEWLEPDKSLRIYFSNSVILNMLRYAKALVDFAFDGQFVIQYCETGAFVYVSFLNQDDETVIIQFGGVVQVKEV